MAVRVCAGHGSSAWVHTGWFILCVLLMVPTCSCDDSMSQNSILEMRDKVKSMFYHGYDAYMAHAFPHDELKPLSATYTDSLAELGNGRKATTDEYQGVAMTLIDSLDTLAVLGNKTEFARCVRWVASNVHFDHDIRVHVFEANIRLLGGLLSAHTLAANPDLELMDDYDGELLVLAHDLGNRLLAAFEDRYNRLFPYAWVNLRSGVQPGEVSDTCTAGLGTFILEFGLLSHLTGDYTFYHVANQVLNRLWKLKSDRGLFGNTLDGQTGRWTNHNSGIGAGIDSFYEYLFKAYIMFGESRFLHMFYKTYTAVGENLKSGPWYVEADMNSGRPTHLQFNSLQAFWPGLQVMFGDLDQAEETQAAFFGVWKRFGALPERYLLKAKVLHSTERYYPLRPEIVESAYYLYRATRDPRYLQMAKHMYESVETTSKVSAGYASIKDVQLKQLEDRMPSFFLAEFCKYLYLIFDDDNFVHTRDDMIFSTEGHLFPVTEGLHDEFEDRYMEWDQNGDETYTEPLEFECPIPRTTPSPLDEARARFAAARGGGGGGGGGLGPGGGEGSAEDGELGQCTQQTSHGKLNIEVGAGSFTLRHVSGEMVQIRNLGTRVVELLNPSNQGTVALVVDAMRGVISYGLAVAGGAVHGASVALFGHEPLSERLDSGEISAPAPIPSSDGVTQQQIVRGALEVAAPRLACGPLTNADALRGKVVYVDRGDCTFVEKLVQVQNAGAIGVVVGNNQPGAESAHFMMGGDGSDRDVSIPAIMVSHASKNEILAQLQQNPGLDVAFLRLRHGSVKRSGEGQPDEAGVTTAPGSLVSSSLKANSERVEAFRYVALGGWEIHVQESNNVYLLSVQSL